MKKLSLLVLLCVSMFGDEFLSEFEYGQMLYRDPRGVSCVPCHGDRGQGRDIVTYLKDDNKTKVTISGPDIRSSTLAQVSDSIKKGQGIMPKYFLTDKEIQTIYAYLKELNSDINGSKNVE